MSDLPVPQCCFCPGTAVSAQLLHLALAVTTVLQALTCAACHALYSHLLRLAGFWLHFQYGGEGAWRGACAAARKEVKKQLSSLGTRCLVMLAKGTWKRRLESQGCEPPRADKRSYALGACHDLVLS